MTYYQNNDDFDARAYGVGNLAPLIGMGSTLAGYMGHSNIAKMLGQAHGLMGNFSKYFPNGLGAFPSQSGFGGSFNPGFQPGFGGQGYPFSGAQGQSFGMPFSPQGTGFGGFGPSFSGYQGAGPGHILHSFFGSPGAGPGFGGGMPGYF